MHVANVNKSIIYVHKNEKRQLECVRVLMRCIYYNAIPWGLNTSGEVLSYVHTSYACYTEIKLTDLINIK